MSKTYTFSLTPYGATTNWGYLSNFNFNQAYSSKAIGYEANYSWTEYRNFGVGLSGSISVVGTPSSISLKVNFSSVPDLKGINVCKKTGAGTSNYGYGGLGITKEISSGAASATIDVTSGGICQYGYFLYQPDYNTYSYRNIIVSSATLTVVTNATDYSYTLAYNANGGSGAPSSQTGSNTLVSPSYTFTISSTKPTRSGYKFLGWSTSSTATSASYSAGGSITVTSSGTTTLYAVWKLDNILRIVNSAGTGLDMYIIYIVQNGALVPYRMTIVNSAGTGLDPYA